MLGFRKAYPEKEAAVERPPFIVCGDGIGVCCGLWLGVVTCLVDFVDRSAVQPLDRYKTERGGSGGSEACVVARFFASR